MKGKRILEVNTFQYKAQLFIKCNEIVNTKQCCVCVCIHNVTNYLYIYIQCMKNEDNYIFLN